MGYYNNTFLYYDTRKRLVNHRKKYNESYADIVERILDFYEEKNGINPDYSKILGKNTYKELLELKKKNNSEYKSRKERLESEYNFDFIEDKIGGE